MKTSRAYNTASNSSEVRREVEKTQFLGVQGKERTVNAKTGFSSIVGRRTKPLVIKY